MENVSDTGWKFDPRQASMSRAETNQTVKFINEIGTEDRLDEILELRRSHSHTWLMFRYQDSERACPFLVEWRFMRAGEEGRPVVWHIDYVRTSYLRRNANFKFHLPWRKNETQVLLDRSFNLWQTIDDAIMSALSLWPPNDRLGHSPKYIAATGGWLNGAWAPEFYRLQECADDSARKRNKTSQGVFEHVVPADAPAVWVFQDGHRADSKAGHWRPFQDDPLFVLEEKIQHLQECRPHLRTTDGLKFIIPLSFRNKHISASYRLLYVDSEIITDRLELNVLDRLQISIGNTVTWGCWIRASYMAELPVFGLINRQTGDQISADNIGLQHSAGKPLAGNIVNRLQHAMLDAWLQWPGAEVELFSDQEYERLRFDPKTFDRDQPEVLSTERLEATGAISFGGWLTSGISFTTRLTVSKELGKNAEGWTPIKPFFDQSDDGILRPATRIHAGGWWDYDPSLYGLVNRKTSQKLVFEGECAVPNRVPPPWRAAATLLFRYEDDQFSYPLIVDRANKILSKVSGQNITPNWIIDHEASLLKWRQETGSSDFPPLGLWQRADSCIFEGLFCWPELELTGPKPSPSMRGGWLNGEWIQDWSRIYKPMHSYWTTHPSDPNPKPWLPPLTTFAPVPWQFVDVKDEPVWVQLDGLERSPYGGLCLDSTRALTGFEGKTPHLIRTDSSSVMFFERIVSEINWADMYNRYALLCYADHEVVFSLEVTATEEIAWYLSNWNVALGPVQQPGIRDKSRFDPSKPLGLPQDLFISEPNLTSPQNYKTYLSAALSARVVPALIDGFAQWAGSPQRRLRDDPDWLILHQEETGVPDHADCGMSLRRRCKISITSPYVAGDPMLAGMLQVTYPQ